MMDADGGRALAVGMREGVWDPPGEPPIVLLHAFPLDSRMWGALAEDLIQRGVGVLGLDYPGFGKTPFWSDVPPSIDAIADAAVAALEGIGVARAHWVGCSMGGYVALAVIERHPDAVTGLGLIDTRSTADDEARREARLRTADATESLSRLSDPEGLAESLIGLEGEARRPVVEKAAAIIAEADPVAVAWGQRAMAARPDRTGVLRGFTGSSVVVWGERDTVSDFGEAETMAEPLGVSVTRIAGVGHLSPIEAPSAVADALVSLRRQA
ncbi:MAG: alpha/beta hydrolase [Demequinaceae bacterium]|nr:alpha/beta hydrolase [Demequinaceae bacterium]